MAYVKSALEIAMEKSRCIDKLSPQEIAEIKQQEEIAGILAKYYKDQIESDDLWYHLKGISNKHLVNTQNNFLQSLTFQSNTYEIDKRKNGILAIENLKITNQSSDIEFYLKQLKQIQEDFQKNKEQLMQELKNELEKDPSKRMQTFQQGNQIMLKQLSVEEVLEENQQLKQRFNQVEKQYKRKFNLIKEKLTGIISE